MSKLELTPQTLLVVWRAEPNKYLTKQYPTGELYSVHSGNVCEILEAGVSAQRLGMTPGKFVILDHTDYWHSSMGHRFISVSEVKAVFEGPRFWEKEE